MVSARVFLDGCFVRGVRLVTGVPCSYLKPLIDASLEDKRFQFRDAVNEGDAVAMAAGAVLGGAPAMAMFQNSGLGNAVNALTSLCYPFRVPILLVITHRGEPGAQPDEPQHEQMGRITNKLLDLLEIPWSRLPRDPAALDAVLDRAIASMMTTRRPYALVLSSDGIEPYPSERHMSSTVPTTTDHFFRELFTRPRHLRATRTQALMAIREARHDDEVLIATTGYTGRELYALGDDPWNLYLVGSMGSASAFGLGLALHHRKHHVTVIDGDGAALMRMGNLATLGAYAPPDFLHVVIDNEVHESTGGQSTVSSGVSFAAVAQACGYRRVNATDDLAQFIVDLKTPRNEGPTLLHFRIRPGSPTKLPRPKTTPEQVFTRLQCWLQAV
ncbi:hypothetical protein Verru16b_03221 [Lacunisphaera limnophila]|uniref:Phosphonopyruvate decarboxylase n=1 Tax=Lacunisphaera limnophila TaxID=1838286 RepID=A0A1D8AZ21_9BACT|nr:phosphonopyruvate decarboxylase [Lacunisphaera limnophila]AOS46125.1 hypothetical protein Verru16b_03221 [Lacunisphaera limnophila]